MRAARAPSAAERRRARASTVARPGDALSIASPSTHRIARPGGASRPAGNIARVIDLDTVRHVARLARLRLDPAEEAKMAEELNGILEHIDRIQGLDLDDVEPTSHVIDLKNVLRDDVPRPSISREDALENAPEVIDGGFGVPKIG